MQPEERQFVLITPRITVGLSCLIALVLSCIAGVVAPPSEFVRESSVWTRLEPLMWPSLFAGPALALLACLLVPFTTRGATILCVLAADASMVGVAVGWGIDAEASLRGLLVPIAFLAVPILGALLAVRYR